MARDSRGPPTEEFLFKKDIKNKKCGVRIYKISDRFQESFETT
jgi:hypothetical protein